MAAGGCAPGTRARSGWARAGLALGRLLCDLSQMMAPKDGAPQSECARRQK